mgnify:CR=1 FL=1|tara:strand:- start:1078 stop:1530 length:453 start_codon:yes stop_codon:yes gene_type:complete
MGRRKKRQKIEGRFVPLQHKLLESKAFQSLTKSAKVAYIYFLFDIKSGHQKEVILTFEQAKKHFVCSSPSTFMKIKKELVNNGFLNQLEGGGLNSPTKFAISHRWKDYGLNDFDQGKYTPGIGSKYFKTAWRDEKKREKLIRARYPNKKN